MTKFELLVLRALREILQMMIYREGRGKAQAVDLCAEITDTITKDRLG